MTAAAAILAALTGSAFAQSNEPCEVHVGFSPRHTVVTEGKMATLNLRADFRGDIPDDYRLEVKYATDSKIRHMNNLHMNLGSSNVSASDYVHKKSSVTLTRAQPSQSITVQTSTDSETERSEQLYVNITVPIREARHRTREEACAEPAVLLDRWGFFGTIHIRD